jgi:hypothetical protein
MSSVSPITIFLTRKNKKDDVISIRPSEECRDCYEVKYRDDDSSSAYRFQDEWQNVEAYLSQIFAVLPFDQDPFQNVQFSLPAYPSILLKPSDTLNPEVMEPLWAMMGEVVRGWPATTKKVRRASYSE